VGYSVVEQWEREEVVVGQQHQKELLCGLPRVKEGAKSKDECDMVQRGEVEW